jgi:tRNA pseudouridine55 synthase
VLPLALGEATKTVSFVMDGYKHYRFRARWGEARDTDDADGQVIETSDVRPDRAAIEAAIPEFVGEIEQVPPAYSAVRVEGRRAYDLAREDKAPVLAARPVTIMELRLVSIPDPDHAEFEMVCGKGSYVRALVRDLARRLGTVGHVTALCRTRVGPFSLEDAFSLADLEALPDSDAVVGRLLPVVHGLDGLPVLSVTVDQSTRLKNGQAVLLVRAPRDRSGALIDGPATVYAIHAERPVAIARYQAGELQPLRVFNL